ncbi:MULTISPECIES: hypothetical protein [Giesbergeria]|uniref:Uncharacterized protein n=1 Tax=Giesbergeria sinuosa TaxID=80883 RepID=A0ABV9QB81_9BURK
MPNNRWQRWCWRVGKTILVLLTTLVLLLAYATYAEHQAEQRAQAFCRPLTPGMDSTHLAEEAILQGAQPRQTRWFQREQGDALLYATFTGMSPFSRHICRITARQGRLVTAELTYLD